MKRIVFIVTLMVSSLSLADRAGTAGTSKSFDAEFERCWNATLEVLDSYTIDQANKDIGQITTKAEKGSNFTGETSRYLAIKISHGKPCKIMVHANIDRVARIVGIQGTHNDTYSDDGLEEKILKSIEKKLNEQPVAQK